LRVLPLFLVLVFTGTWVQAEVSEQQKRAFEAVLDIHQVITSDLDKNIRRLSGLCLSGATSKSGLVSPRLKEQLKLLEQRTKQQQSANRSIRGLVQKVEGDKALALRQWADRWEALQMKRLSLLQEVAALEAKGCVREGFFGRLFAANNELIAADPNGGLLIFEELTGLAAEKPAQENEQQRPTLLRDIFEQLFGGKRSGQPSPQGSQ
jgi:hypothetical protein